MQGQSCQILPPQTLGVAAASSERNDLFSHNCHFEAAREEENGLSLHLVITSGAGCFILSPQLPHTDQELSPEPATVDLCYSEPGCIPRAQAVSPACQRKWHFTICTCVVIHMYVYTSKFGSSVDRLIRISSTRSTDRFGPNLAWS